MFNFNGLIYSLSNIKNSCSILPLLKVKALDKFSGILTFVAAALLIVGGIFAFCEKAAILGSDAKYVSDAVSLGAGWIVAGIMAIISGAIALLSKLLDK